MELDGIVEANPLFGCEDGVLVVRLGADAGGFSPKPGIVADLDSPFPALPGGLPREGWLVLEMSGKLGAFEAYCVGAKTGSGNRCT